MKVLVISKNNLTVSQVTNVTNIAFTATQVTITGTGGSTWALADYVIQILW